MFFFFFFFFGPETKENSQFPSLSLINSIKTDKDLNELWYNCFDGADNMEHINKFRLERLKDKSQLKQFLNSGAETYRTWLVQRDAEKDIIGFALHYFDKNEISFSIGLNYINQGYGTEVAKLLVDKLEVEGIKEANAYCAADNYAAIRVLDKCGFENMGLAADKKLLRFNLKI